MTKQQQIDDLNERLKESYEAYQKLSQKKDDDFTDSTIYKEMQRELLLAQTLSEFEGKIRRQIQTDMTLYEENKRLRKDNEELCKSHDAKYWEGFSNYNGWDFLDRKKADREILKLKAALAAKDAVIEHLKYIIAGEEPSPAPANPVGHPRTIDEETKARVRKYRRQGWTMQQIANAEGISKGSVSAIVKAAGINKSTKKNR